ncbi:MAG: SDR family NAD(P)-dependent oxidoreductase [Chloroflexi bacterium]|nr:SDR family NAD(P)-dependent oxidoreductase [Chloroflexota bacterium]
MTTLVTGGAGFIGSRLAARLLAQGQPVVILDNFDDYYDPAVKRANVAALNNQAVVVEADIRDRALVESLFDRHGINRVAHLAGLAGVRNSVEQGALYADVNTTGSVNLMDIARRRGVSIFVQASTSSVYGQATRIPFVEEDAPDFPLAPYPASKRAAELFGYSYHQLFGLNFTALRFFNVYGPFGRPDMMPLKAIEAILNNQVIPMYDGGQLQRDWTYVDDIVSGVVAALERPMGYMVINLGCGSPIPLTEFIHIYERLIGKKALTKPVPAPASEPRVTYCDNTRARQLLDFQPTVQIEEGLARTWEWYKTHHNVLTKS